MERTDYRVNFTYTGDRGQPTAGHGYLSREGGEPLPSTEKIEYALRWSLHRPDLTVQSVDVVQKREW